MTENIHATCVDWQGQGILLLGAPGSGKSDLALRLISGKNCLLVADDRTDLNISENKIIASAPKNISGLLEVRGVGILKMPVTPQTTVKLAVVLASSPMEIERLPQNKFYDFGGVKVRQIKLCAFEASAADKIIAALSCEDFELSC